jgi:hypothetical protein
MKSAHRAWPTRSDTRGKSSSHAWWRRYATLSFSALVSQPPQATLDDLKLTHRALGPCANSPLETRREAVYTLKDFSHASVRKRVTLSQDGGRTCIQVHASDFMYHAGDKVSYEWKDSTGTHHLHMPAYCLTNLRDIQLALNVYLQRKRNDYDFMLQKSNLLTRTTIFTALNFAHSKKVPSNA